MLFNSLDFAWFLPIVFILYWTFKRNISIQNIILLVASYVFYGWWDWRFLSLIFLSTVVDFFIGRFLSIQKETRKRKLLLWTSISINLGLLGFFKYYNFFIDNFISAFTFLGVEFEFNTLNIILPVGISFYTFQTLSYTIDVYRKELSASTDFIAFSTFVSFFPQLVAGPIERATNLLPQFSVQRTFSYPLAVDGLRQILWGFFKKIVIADNCAVYANQIFADSANMNGSSLVLGAFFFTFQIYGDFSGYSDIAIGTSRLFGFNLMQNFAFPYFSRDIAEFWRRWHISLSTWFRDYLYIPLGGSKGGLRKKIRNTFIIFVVSGFWHGANWTFIVWGALNALYFMPLLLTNKNRKNLEVVAMGKIIPSLKDVASILFTFCLTMLAWIFFRADNIGHALDYVRGIFNFSLFNIPNTSGLFQALQVLLLIVVFVAVEWLGRRNKFALEGIDKIKIRPLRWLILFLLLLIIYLFGNYGDTVEFIYFQF